MLFYKALTDGALESSLKFQSMDVLFE